MTRRRWNHGVQTAYEFGYDFGGMEPSYYFGARKGDRPPCSRSWMHGTQRNGAVISSVSSLNEIPSQECRGRCLTLHLQGRVCCTSSKMCSVLFELNPRCVHAADVYHQVSPRELARGAQRETAGMRMPTTMHHLILAVHLCTQNQEKNWCARSSLVQAIVLHCALCLLCELLHTLCMRRFFRALPCM